MYVNGTVGYLVSTEEIVGEYASKSLDLDTNAHSNLFNYEQQRELVTA